MGNQSSHNGESKRKDSEKVSNDIPNYYNMDNLSSYKGLKTESNSETGARSDTCSHTTDKATESTSVQEKRYQVHFEWKEGGNKVLITGSFINWNTFIEMTKVNEIFQFNINLAKGVYQFKFIVDGIWKTSNFYQKTRDNNGNENNVIDLTNIKEPDVQAKKENRTQSQSEDLRNVRRNEYNSYYPKQNEMNADAPHVPYHYLRNYNINYNTRQDRLGIKRFLIYNEKNLLSENNSYKKVLLCPHVNLNHECTNCVQHSKYIRTSVSQRIRHKFLTVIYYKPQEK